MNSQRAYTVFRRQDAIVTLNPERIKVLFQLIVAFGVLAVKVFDFTEVLLRRLQHFVSNATKIQNKTTYIVESGINQSSETTVRKLHTWLNSPFYRINMVYEYSVKDAIMEILLMSMWTTMASYYCQLYQRLDLDNRRNHLNFLRKRYLEVYESADDVYKCEKRVAMIKTFSLSIFKSTDDELHSFLLGVSKDILSRNPCWLAQYVHCRFRSEISEADLFQATVSYHAAVSRWIDGSLQSMHDAFFNRKYRQTVCMLLPLMFYSAEKCILPHCLASETPTTTKKINLENFMQHVWNHGIWHTCSWKYFDRTSRSYKDRLVYDVAMSIDVGKYFAEWDVGMIERAIWIAEHGMKRLSGDTWTELVRKKRSLIADLTNMNIQELLCFAMAGIVNFISDGDCLFKIIGSKSAALQLKCILPKITLEDLIKTELVKTCSSGRFIISKIPGSPNPLKVISVEGRLLVVRSTEFVEFSANTGQLVI